jgi:histidine kinase
MRYAHQIPGYELESIIHSGINTIVYRGIDQSTSQPVILKILKPENSTPKVITRIHHEYQIAKKLDHKNIVKVLGLESYGDLLLLVFHDFGGKPLQELVDHSRFDVNTFLTIALQLAEALEYLHANSVIHKDIKPTNIIINSDTQCVKLTDFSISSQLTNETTPLTNPSLLEGTLAYISPEQTGRMNRNLDYRTDFYSLGITFYEMLVGKLPFFSNDPLELIHQHIARLPTPIQQFNSDIPDAIASIIHKLIAKNPEDRYQTAKGLVADLKICLHQYSANREITVFPPARLDTKSQLNISQKFYGRERQLNLLLNAFDRVSKGSRELFLISGDSGVGKSSLVNEVYISITKARAYFINGKFDHFHEDIPYYALIQAFTLLIRELLTESISQVETWRSRIIGAVGLNGQVIIDIIPELQFIIGTQPEVPNLPAIEAENRFNLAFQALIRVFAQAEHPLVIFIDDLQWTDCATLKLLQVLINDSNCKYLLVIGAYRDTKISPNHPLIKMIEKIQTTNSYQDNKAHQEILFYPTFNHVTLQPLSQENVRELISDTLQTQTKIDNDEINEINELANFLHNHTHGNPFFLKHLLQTLYQQEIIIFDINKQFWYWHIEKILFLISQDKNIVEMIAGKIEKLSIFSQEILKIAACIGDKFNLKVLGIICQKSPIHIAEELYSFIQIGLIIPLNNNYRIPLLLNFNESINFDTSEVTYKFLNNQIQQAAYSLIPDSQKFKIHLHIGKLLLTSINSDKLETDTFLFHILNQFNQGIFHITIKENLTEEELTCEKLTQGEFSQEKLSYKKLNQEGLTGEKLISEELNLEELNKIVELYLIAGEKAKKANAYKQGLKYLQSGISLLNGDSWDKKYEITLKLHIEATEAAYLSGDFQLMQELADTVLEKAKEILDTIKIYEIKILASLANIKLQEGICIGLSVLNKLGLNIPESPTDNEISNALSEINELIPKEEIYELINLPSMVDKNALLSLQILSHITTAAYITSPDLFILTTIAQLKLSRLFGNAPLSAYAYAYYGSILCGRVNDIKSGYRFGKLALQLLPQFDDKAIYSKVVFVVALFTSQWRFHIRESIPLFQLGYESGLEAGDLDYAAWHYYNESLHSYWVGQELTGLEKKIGFNSKAISQIRQQLQFDLNEMLRQKVLNLLDKSVENNLLIGEAYDEKLAIIKYQSLENILPLYFVYLFKLILSYLFAKYDQAVENTCILETYLYAASGQPSLPIFYLYSSLARLAIYNQVSELEKQKILEKCLANQTKIKYWATHAPMNFQYHYDLVEAEICRVKSDNYQAMEYYDKAIAAATKNGFIQASALASELAAKFYLEKDKEKIAKVYMTDAYYGYIKWGALAKVKYLEKNYSNLISLNSINLNYLTKPYTHLSTAITTRGTTTSTTSFIDLATIVKASEVIQSEIILENLPRTLLHIIIENTGAQNGCLILEKSISLNTDINQNIQPKLYVEAIDKGGQISTFMESIPIEECNDIPQLLINYVERSKQPVVIRDATLDPLSKKDPYIQINQSKSVLCLPIFYQAQFIGIFYLENNLTTGLFTPQRLELLKILASQAAIAIKNARLYSEEQKKSQQLLESLQKLKETQEILVDKATVLEETLFQLQQTQSQLVHTEKISSLGQLVAGLAHEVNNPVNYINGNLSQSSQVIKDLIHLIDLYQKYFPNPPEEIALAIETMDLEFIFQDLPKMIASMKLGTTRIRDIMSSLRNFSRNDGDEKKAIDIHQGIEATLMILSHRLKANPERPGIRVIKDYGELPFVECYPGQLNQVFMNLLANAIDALEESNNGKAFEEIQGLQNIISITTGIEDENLITVSISDNGPGMKEEVKNKLFTAFFTTKPEGKGTGLGLSISYQIITEKHGGTLECISSLGKGTTFIISIPYKDKP